MASPATLKAILEDARLFSAVTYVLDRNNCFVYCNPEWDRFAYENGAPQLANGSVLGHTIFESIPPILAHFYNRAFQNTRRNQAGWEFLYECSSADRFRKFKMRIDPVLEGDWLLVRNILVIERPHEELLTSKHRYLDANGVVTMCCHCRSVRRMGRHEHWDFVPGLVRSMPLNIAHGICPACCSYFYPNVHTVTA